MATYRDTYGSVLSRSNLSKLSSPATQWLGALLDGGSMSGSYVKDKYGNRVAEMRGDRVYDTYGNWVGEFRFGGKKFFDTYGKHLFSID